MNGICALLKLFFGVIESVLILWTYAWVFFHAFWSSRAGAAVRIVALESQLDECLRVRGDKRVGRFSTSFRFLWILLSRFWEEWKHLCHAMKPRTVVSWGEKLFKWHWRWISRVQVGRKPIDVELRELIRRVSKENPLWGAGKIRDVLVDLGFVKLDVKTVRKYMPKRARPKNPSGNWLSFIRNHMNVSWAMDFCVVRTIGFRPLYLFVIIEHGRRRIRHWNVTESPSLDCIMQQLREATPFGEVPRFMHRGNDQLYGKRVARFLKDSEIEEVKSAYHSPWQNPFIERFFGSLRRELLNHVIIFNEHHLTNLMGEYVTWHEDFRLHQGLNGECPNPRKEKWDENAEGTIVSIPVLGGLHHRYERVAA